MRIPVAVALLAAGAATAVATVALHQMWWGLLLGVAATTAALVAVGRGWWTRLPFGVGWAGLVVYLLPSRPDGGYLVADTGPGYALIGCALLVLVFSVATLPRPGGPPT